MRTPNFKTEEGSILYKDTVGRLISPRVADVLLARARARLLSSDIRRVLDLGCGPGAVSLPLARGNPQLQVVGVDASAAMIALARAEAAECGLQNIQFRQMDAGRLELPPGAFDLALCNLAYPFFAKPDESMRAVHDLLRPGGQVFFTVPGRRTWDEFFAVAAAVLGGAANAARPFLAKFSQAETLPAAMSEAEFVGVTEERTLLPFRFARGEDVLAFFSDLFHLLDHAPPDMKSEIAEAIDVRHPGGFTMHYDVVLLGGERGGEAARRGQAPVQDRRG